MLKAVLKIEHIKFNLKLYNKTPCAQDLSYPKLVHASKPTHAQQTSTLVLPLFLLLNP